MMLYIRAEREGEFGLHLYACKQMIPYFFEASHVNYARYGLCYIKKMEKLPIAVLHSSLSGEHVACHQEDMECNLHRHVNRHYVYALCKGTYRIDWCNHQITGSSDMGQKPTLM